MVYGLKAGTRDAMFGRIVDAVDRIRDIYRKLKRATRAVYNRAARCVAARVGGGVL